MRVITGSARGKRLKELPGLDTRPTTDRVKEGLFNAIQFDLEGRRALDLFAGTGQLGVEALSRGAAWCDFVDRSAAAMRVVRENVAACGFEGRAAFFQKDFYSVLSTAKPGYGVVFLDPPYSSGDLERALLKLGEIDIVAENGIIVCEAPAGTHLPAPPGPWDRSREYRYGKIGVTVFRRRVEP